MSEHSFSEETRTDHSEAYSYSTRRYFKRHDEPRRWWPLGILPLLLLGLLFALGAFFIAPDMQEKTQASVESALQEAGYSQLDVAANGQRVSIKGAAHSDESSVIKQIALEATCDSFIAKGLVCPTRAEVDVESIKELPHHDFSFVRTAKGLVLRGDVPGVEMHEEVLDQAKARFSSIIDSLSIVEDITDARFGWAASKAWSLLDRINTGKVDWSGGVLSLNARTVRENEESIRMLFSSARFPERMGTLRFQFEQDVDLCNQKLGDSLAETMIYFETGSAVISEGSNKLLLALADIAGECPGDLIIEGHTDNVGEDASNLRLSQRRADAVVASLSKQGVDGDRLSAIGYGEARPVMSNETPQGRAMNRRIAIRVAEFN